MTVGVWITSMRSKGPNRIERTLARATASSLLATLVDAVFYQLGLFVLVGRYGVCAALAAVAGAVTNFSVNRHWTFAATGQGVLLQACRYAVVSLATFGCLRLLLWLLIEHGSVGMRIAWLPAKILAFLLVSFPLQHIWVFRAKS
jgi:putative flippase GtrA